MMTNLFKSMNLIRRGSGAHLNLFRYAAMVVMLLMLGVGNAWGGTAYTRGRAFLKEGCPTGSGKVYVGGGDKPSTPGTYTQLNSYDTPVTDEKAEAQATRTYYFYAQANSGYKFTGWYKKNQGFNSPFSTVSKVNIDSLAGNTLTAIYPAFPKNSHSSAMSS